MSDYFESGFSVREPMWHGKGEIKDRHPKDWDEAREWAGLTWEPEESEIYERRGKLYVPIKGWKRIARNDNGATLTVRTHKYTLITHKMMGEIMEALLEQPNVKYETAGSVHDGKKVWALVYLDEPIQLPGDPSLTLPFLTLLNHHDGSGGCAATPTNVRVCCANTFSAAEQQGERQGSIFNFAHTPGVMDRIEEARETILGLRKSIDEYKAVAESLLGIQFTPAMSEQFIREFIPNPPEGLVSDRVMNNVEKARDLIRTILAGPTSDGIGDTAWGHVQAAGEYLDHYRQARTLDSAYTRSLLRPERLKSKAVTLAREIAKV